MRPPKGGCYNRALSTGNYLTLKHITVIALTLCVLGASRPAQAQIYSWRDPNGVLVLSSAPKGGAVPHSVIPRSIAQVGAPLLRTISSSYDAIIQEHSLLQNVRADLVRAVIQVESAFNPKALSPKGAMGLMQLMPSTAARFGVLNAFNPAENIRAGVSYLKQLLNRYQNNEELALAAYNAGPQAVDKYHSQVPPYKETQDYVHRISAIRGTTPRTTSSKIYKTVDFVNGQPVVRYTDVKPSSGN